MANQTWIKEMQINELPQHIQQSQLFDSSDLSLLASQDSLPFIDPAYHDDRLKNIFQYYSIDPGEMEKELQLYAKELLAAGKIKEAWQVLLSAG